MVEGKTKTREEEEASAAYLKSGINELSKESSNIIRFIDPIRIMKCNYTQFRVSQPTYHSRFLQSNSQIPEIRVSTGPPKRKRKKRKLNHDHHLNEREESTDQRHKEARPLLLEAHEALLNDTGVLSLLSDLRRNGRCSSVETSKELVSSFIDLASVWQASMYDISLYFKTKEKGADSKGSALVQSDESKVLPIFNNFVVNNTSTEVEARFLKSSYILPRESCFHMSNLEKIRNLIPANPDSRYNLIVIDPPWENGSACQKSLYPTLPNKYFLSLPVKQLTHADGALVALWITNREKLRDFVDKELFPSWGVTYKAIVYWVKVKADGSLIGELDLFHHRPYECLLLGYSPGKGMKSEQVSALNSLPEKQVIISVPGDYSRKPPIGELLVDYVPGQKQGRCIELFARELFSGWTSWGNEPLHFQESSYFLSKSTVD